MLYCTITVRLCVGVCVGVECSVIVNWATKTESALWKPERNLREKCSNDQGLRSGPVIHPSHYGPSRYYSAAREQTMSPLSLSKSENKRFSDDILLGKFRAQVRNPIYDLRRVASSVVTDFSRLR